MIRAEEENRERQRQEQEAYERKMSAARNQRKHTLEQRLKDICDELNELKEKLSSVEVTLVVDNVAATRQSCRDQSSQIDSYEDKLNRVLAEVHSVENSPADSTVLTQVELIKSFVGYLMGKVGEKKREIRRKETLVARLAECEANLTSYVTLAKQLSTSGPKTTSSSGCVENRGDLQGRIESIESIERSVRDCLKQIAEIRGQFHSVCEESSSSKSPRDEIHETVMKPLSQQSSYLRMYLTDLDEFSIKLAGLKDYLKVELNWDSLVGEMKSGTARLTSDLVADQERFTALRDKLARKMSQSSDLFVLGASLFDRSSRTAESVSSGQDDDRLVVSSVAQEFDELRVILNDLARFLNETCMLIECARHRLDKMGSLESRTNELLNEIELVERMANEFEKDNEDEGESCGAAAEDMVRLNKARLERIVELKKALRAIMDEKDMLAADTSDYSGDAGQKAEFDARIRTVTNSTMTDFNNRLDGLIKFAKERFAYFEVMHLVIPPLPL